MTFASPLYVQYDCTVVHAHFKDSTLCKILQFSHSSKTYYICISVQTSEPHLSLIPIVQSHIHHTLISHVNHIYMCIQCLVRVDGTILAGVFTLTFNVRMAPLTGS